MAQFNIPITTLTNEQVDQHEATLQQCGCFVVAMHIQLKKQLVMFTVRVTDATEFYKRFAKTEAFKSTIPIAETH